MPTICTFKLNKPNANYVGGKTISGTITLQTTSEKQVKDIKIIFLGEGKVQWEEFDLCTAISTVSQTFSSITATYTSHRVYIKETTIVHGEGLLPIGTHTYAFNIRLPLECPGSFKSAYGHIDYELCLKINRKFHSDNVFKKPVTVTKTVDLNSDPNYKLPLAVKVGCNVGFWTISMGKIFCTLTIPFSAYTPGQSVVYTLHITNQSVDDTRGYNIEFIKNTSYVGKYLRRKERHFKDTLLARYFPSQCLRQASRIIKGEFVIPNSCTVTDTSSIIRIEYLLKVRLKLKGCSSNPHLILPLTIGSIPIRESLSRNQVVARRESERIDGETADSLQLGGKVESEQPPSYSEATELS